MAKRANEIIAFHLCWDVGEVTDGRYQRYSCPNVYVCGGSYFACPTKGQKLPTVTESGVWEKVGTYYGRDVFQADP